jgi:intracellular sulfur oxidation DsrE/DsrF family protein
MLHDMALISQSCLERIRNKVLDGQFLDRDELREFKDICETVLRQTRVEIEVEQHASQRTSAMSGEQIQVAIMEALQEAGIDTGVCQTVLKALGIQTSS